MLIAEGQIDRWTAAQRGAAILLNKDDVGRSSLAGWKQVLGARPW
jgi:hypothetical protein